MGTHIFAHAKSIQLKCEKYADKIAEMGDPEEYDTTYCECFQTKYNIEMNRFKKILEISSNLDKLFKEYTFTEKGFFITIRPLSGDFELFKNMCFKFVERKCFLSYAMSFEQKGIERETLGEGYHCHIIGSMTQRSKGEVLRDTKSSFAKLINENILTPAGIQVEYCRDTEKVKTKYLIEYVSKDGHKEITKIWDAIWRTQLNLKSIYEKIKED